MQNRVKPTFLFCLMIFSGILVPNARAQHTYLPIGDEAYDLLDKFETKSGAFSNDFFLNNHSFGVNRQSLYDYLSDFQNESYVSLKSSVDNYLVFKTLSENGEWKKPNSDGAQFSKYSLGALYRYQNDMVNINRKDFFWSLNPVLGAKISYAQKPADGVLWDLTEGLETRGRVADFMGFYLRLSNTNLTAPSYQRARISDWNAFPGIERYRSYGNSFAYLDFEGNLDFKLIENCLSFDIGYGRHFFGDGMRTMFMSDNGGNNFYVGFNTKIWRINYQNLFMQLHKDHLHGMPTSPGHKYASVHFISANVRPWLNIGMFETVTFSRNGAYEIGYLNPLILYRAVERDLGSPDKMNIGISASAIAAHKFKFYGQFLINEFTTSFFFKRAGYWANKWGAQLGLKYFDAFAVPNLYVQAEMNMVRPYTFTHSRGNSNLVMSNFASGNQPLAHPLGADFQELLGVVKYRPVPKMSLELTAMLYRQSVDSGGISMGNNIFEDYANRTGVFDVNFINGPVAKVFMTNLHLSYELRPQLYLFAEGTYRKSTVAYNLKPAQQDLFYSMGFRLNLNRRMYQWY